VATYRDLIRPSLVDTAIPSNGKAEAAQALANTFKEFEQFGQKYLAQQSAEAGRREGAEAGRTDHPGFRTGMASLTAYGNAYNDSATRSYAIKSEIAADEAATRIENESGSDPAKFRAAFGARRDEILKEAPPEARAILSEVYDKRMANGVKRLVSEQSKQIREQSRTDVIEGLQRGTDRLAQLRASDDPANFEEAEQEQVKLDLLIDASIEDGTFSAVEGATLRLESARQATSQVVTYRFRNVLDDPYQDPVAFLENLREVNKKSNVLPPEEEAKLFQGLIGELQERNALASAARTRSNTAQKIRWDAGEATATDMLLKGSLTVNTLSAMRADDELDPAIARTLLNELQAGSDRPDDTRERFRVETTLLDQEEEDIKTNSSLSWKTRTELVLKRRELMNTWRGTQQAREGQERIDRALKIPPGMNANALSPDQLEKRDRAVTEWYSAVDALPPGERQQKAIEVSESIINRIIRTDAQRRAATLGKRIAELQTKLATGDLDEEQIKQTEKSIADYERKLKAAEAQAK
jgi:hypothetical protein